MSDVGSKTFTDAGGSGLNSHAYQNWKAHGRNTAGAYDYPYCAMVGQAIDEGGEKYLSSVTDGNFSSDGMFYLPMQSWDIDRDSIRNWGSAWMYHSGHHNTADYSHNQSFVISYQSKLPTGLPAGQLFPVFAWNALSQLPGSYYGNRKQPKYDELASIDDAYDDNAHRSENTYSPNNTSLPNTASVIDQIHWGPHLNYGGLGGNDSDSVEGTDVYMRNDLRPGSQVYIPYYNRTNVSGYPGRPMWRQPSDNSGTGFGYGGYSFGGHTNWFVMYYGHDGNGNGVLVSFPHGGILPDHVHAQSQSYNQLSSTDSNGMTIHAVPKKLQNISDYPGGIVKWIDEKTRATGSRFIPDPDNLDDSLDMQVFYGVYTNSSYYRRGYGLSLIHI